MTPQGPAQPLHHRVTALQTTGPHVASTTAELLHSPAASHRAGKPALDEDSTDGNGGPTLRLSALCKEEALLPSFRKFRGPNLSTSFVYPSAQRIRRAILQRSASTGSPCNAVNPIMLQNCELHMYTRQIASTFDRVLATSSGSRRRELCIVRTLTCSERARPNAKAPATDISASASRLFSGSSPLWLNWTVDSRP